MFSIARDQFGGFAQFCTPSHFGVTGFRKLGEPRQEFYAPNNAGPWITYPENHIHRVFRQDRSGSQGVSSRIVYVRACVHAHNRAHRRTRLIEAGRHVAAKGSNRGPAFLIGQGGVIAGEAGE
jgi:hypothetical protein